MNQAVRIAILDMNNSFPNQGLANIIQISENFKNTNSEQISIEVFDVRYKNEMPNIEDFDIFISSGGPGNPHKEGFAWETPYANFLNGIWDYNKNNEDKKYLFLICHSFQLAVINWKLANVCKRKSYSFGVMPIHKTEEGEHEILFKNLPEPFYAVDSRSYQCIEPNDNKLSEMGMKVVAIEKMRPNIQLERALMAIRFSDEIFGTQFHPEANPAGMLENLKDESNKQAMISSFGMEKYLETLDRIDDEDKIILTQKEILPSFLKMAQDKILQALAHSLD